jgi:hypothetical protein
VSDEVFGALIGGGLTLAGALLVFIFTVLYTEIKEARQRSRVRRGYARLLDSEIEANGKALDLVQAQGYLSWGYSSSDPGERPPTDVAWKEVRTSLAPLMKPEDFRALANYYRQLGALVELAEHLQETEGEDQAGSADKTDWTVLTASYALIDETQQLRSMLSRYA